MDLEEAFQVVGEFGPYQKRAVVVLVLTQVCERNREDVLMRNRPAAVTWRSAKLSENRRYVASAGGGRLEDHEIQFVLQSVTAL